MKHKHHIVPRHMGGADEASNIIEVSVKEHAELHFALYLEYGNWQDLRAAYGLAGLSGWECVEGYGFKGRTHTPETKEKIRAKLKKRKLTEKHKKKIGQAHEGKIITEDVRMRISNTLLGYKHTDQSKYNMAQAQRNKKVKTKFSQKCRQNCYKKTSKKVMYNGIVYNSIREASRMEKVGRTEIVKNGVFDI